MVFQQLRSKASVVLVRSLYLPVLVIPEILLLVEQIRPRTTQVDDLRTPVPILLQARTLEAIEGV